MEVKQGATNFDIENPKAPLLGFKKQYMKKVNIHLKRLLIIWCDYMILVLLTFFVMLYLVLKIMEITQTYYILTLTEPRVYLKNIIPTNILYQNVTNSRIEYIEYHIKDGHGRPIDFNGDVLSFTLHLVLLAEQRSICFRLSHLRSSF